MVASTSSTLWAGLAFPLSTAPVSSVRRWGKYHSVPSTFWMRYPENMVAKRLIGVSAPGAVPAVDRALRGEPWPRWACAASRLDGEVAALSA